MPDPSTGSDTPRQVVLLIDEDPKAVRLVRLSLHGPTCNVLTATRHLEGLRLAARQKPHLILMETRFKGMDGFTLAGKLLVAPETQGSIVAFLTEDGTLTSRVRGIQLGGAEYIQKPLDGRQLASRVTALFARLSSGRRPAPPQGAGVGELLEHVQRIEEAMLSGTLSLQRGSQSARVEFVQGAVRAAECGPLRGEEALNEIASRGDWTLHFGEEASELGGAPIRRRRTSDATRPEMPAKTPKPILRSAPSRPAPSRPAPAPVQLPKPIPSRLPPARSAPVAPAATLRPAPSPPPPAGALPRPVRHLSAAQTATVHDSAVAQPRPPPRPQLAPEPELGLVPIGSELDDDDQTVVEANQRSILDAATQPGQRAVPEIVISSVDSGVTDQGPALVASAAGKSAPPTRAAPIAVAKSVETGHDQEQSTLRHSDFGEPGDGFDEDIPTAMSFKAQEVSDLNLSQSGGGLRFSTSDEEVVVTTPSPPAVRSSRPLPQQAFAATPSSSTGLGAPTASPPSTTPAPRELLRRWLAEQGGALLIVAPPTADRVRAPLQQAAEAIGFQVHHVVTGLDAYRFALEHRPTAVLSDLRGPDLDGRELLAAIRSDFCVRETPFIMVSSEYLASQLQLEGPAGLGPILQGLEAALAPRVALEERTRAGGELVGWVEPIGISFLLRAIGAAGLSGRLQLNTKEGRGAVVIFRRGEICGATVNAAQATVGPMAMLHLLGYEWQEFAFVPEAIDSGQVPLGELSELIETAFHQNNVLLTRVYQQGVQIEEVSVDSNALDLYLQRLPPGSLELLIRLVEGEKASVLAEKNVAAPGLLKSILHDLRRKAVIQPLSMKPVKLEERLALSPNDTSTSKKKPRRWLVALIACLVTVLLAGGGYFAYWYFYLNGKAIWSKG